MPDNAVMTEALRPAFTMELAERLQAGGTINLISLHGQGRRRTLTDLRQCLPSSLRVLQANLRDCPHSLTALLDTLARQVGLAEITTLEALLDRLASDHAATLIILHNFDELQPGEASGYDDPFFMGLNSIANRETIALLCISEQLPNTWPLQIEALPLPPLNRLQLLDELYRRQPPGTADKWPEIAAWLASQDAPYTLLDQPEAWPA